MGVNPAQVASEAVRSTDYRSTGDKEIGIEESHVVGSDKTTRFL